MLDFLQEFFEGIILTYHDDVTYRVAVLCFVQQLLLTAAVHPELADRPFYVTGESYAGHYVPAVSHRVWLANKRNEGKPINLHGIAIG